jgi:hypothetical protein
VRDRVATAEPEPWCPDPKISETNQRGPDDQVALIPRKLGCTFPRDLNLIALFDHCQIDPFSPIQGEPETIESGAEVRRGGRNLHGHRPTSGQHQES